MFIGHFATGLVFYIQKQGGKLALFFLVLGTQFVDVLWGIFTALGIEGGTSLGSVEYNYFVTPWSHSLLMMFVWSILYGLGTNWIVKKRASEIPNFSIIAGLSVFSHWLLDFIVHNNDMQIIPTSDATLPSLYLWQYPLIVFILEFLIIFISWELYIMKLKSNDNITNYTKPRIMGIVLILIHIINFIPSLIGADGIDVDQLSGFFGMVGIVILVGIMTWLHPQEVSN